MPPTPILTVNAGSTSTKLAVIDDTDDVTWSRTIPFDPTADPTALHGALEDARHVPVAVTAVGHRIVHGGTRFVGPVLVDDEVLTAIGDLTELVPLHNQAGLAGIIAARAAFPELPHVACFDTAFHATIPRAAYTYGGPRQWLDQGYRRYGFHGLSYQHAATRSPELLQRPSAELALIVCHLGGGCSITAIADGHSIDTTMGFTPLDGLVMATRSGSIDPALLLYLLRHGVGLDELDDTLEHHSGLLGLSGVSGDVREVITARDQGHVDAALAIDVFVHRLASGIGAMTAALDHLDAIVFTGGIGENNPEIRARAVERLAWLGATISPAANEQPHLDTDIATHDAATRILVIKSREDLIIAHASRITVA